jgi:hypothetical protein
MVDNGWNRAGTDVATPICLAAPICLGGIWSSLDQRGYALTNDREIGLVDGFREYFRQTYFNAATLRRDEGDWPVDRQRARDVIRYRWNDEHLDLREYESVTITNRSGIQGRRDHKRVELLGDQQAKNLVSTLLSLVPQRRRQPEGTFSVNLFRTFTKVVTKPHHDDEEFLIFYVLGRTGGGAVTYLYEPGDVLDGGQPVAEPVLSYQLDPGEIIIFEDKNFKHGATPLQSLGGERAMRDTLVCSVDYRSTYLDPGALREAR